MGSIVIVGGGGGGRTVLTVDKNYYVAATGNNSNPGTIGAPWATLQHAMDFVAGNVDFTGFNIIVNIGAGSFVGFGVKSTVGGGNLLFLGAGSASTTITRGPNDGVFNFGECVSVNVICGTPIAANQVAFKQRATLGFGSNAVAMYQPGCFFFLQDPITSTALDIKFDLSAGGSSFSVVEMEADSVVQFGPGTMTIVGGGTTLGDSIIDLTEGAICFFSSTLTVTGALTVGVATVHCIGNSTITAAGLGGSFTGVGIVGPRFFANLNGSIDAADAAGTFFPGSAAGRVTGGGEYSGVSDYNGNAAGLPTATIQGAKCFVTDSLNPVFGNIVAGGGGVYTPVYADATNWRWG